MLGDALTKGGVGRAQIRRCMTNGELRLAHVPKLHQGQRGQETIGIANSYGKEGPGPSTEKPKSFPWMRSHYDEETLMMMKRRKLEHEEEASIAAGRRQPKARDNEEPGAGRRIPTVKTEIGPGRRGHTVSEDIKEEPDDADDHDEDFDYGIKNYNEDVEFVKVQKHIQCAPWKRPRESVKEEVTDVQRGTCGWTPHYVATCSEEPAGGLLMRRR